MLQEVHSAMLLTFIKLTSVIKIFVLSIFEWPFKKGFTVFCTCVRSIINGPSRDKPVFGGFDKVRLRYSSGTETS